MLESLAANVLNRLLGAYIENFDPAQLNVGIWSGDVVLKNMKLRKDCLDSLDLPIDVKFGVLGNLVLTVPWSSLKNKPVKIIIEDCFLLCAARDPLNCDTQDIIARELSLKLKKLAEWELRNQHIDSIDTNNENNETFMQSLLTKIVDNLQITIKNIHIRYEDTKCVLSKEPYSLGITLREISAVSTDEGWVPNFISISRPITHKLLTLNSLCLYWNVDSTNIENYNENEDFDTTVEKFKRAILSSETEVDNYRYLLKPINGIGKLSVNKLGSTEVQPHILLEMEYDEFSVDLGDVEYANLMHTLSSLQINKDIEKYKGRRPLCSVTDDPKAWLKYTIQTIAEKIKSENQKWTWENIKKSCDQRREYIALWLDKLQLPTIDDELADSKKQQRLSELESELSFEAIILYRSMAKKMNAQLQKENDNQIKDNELNRASQNSTGTWLSSIWTGKPLAETQKELELSEEQRKELYEAIEFTEDDDAILPIPSDRVKLKVTSVLKKGSFSIIKRENVRKLGEIIFEGCSFHFCQRPHSYLASFQIHQFRLEDGSPNTLYKHIISVNALKTLLQDETTSQDPETEPLLDISYDSNPLNNEADTKLSIRLRGMTVFYHVHFINEIINFFNQQNDNQDTIGAIINAAETTMEGWTSQTRMGLEALLEEHKTIDLNLDLQAPLILLPLDPHKWDTPCAVIDAGHIKVTSELISKEKIKSVKEMSVEDYDKIDGSEINRLMFDRFHVSAQDTQILIGPDVRRTISSLAESNVTNNFSILEKIYLNLIVDVSILPKAHNLPKIRSFVSLPELSVSLNDEQYKYMMLIINNIMPTPIELNSDEFLNSDKGNAYIESKKMEIKLAQTANMLKNKSESELNQKLLDINFDINNINLTVYHCKDTQTMKSTKLISIVGNSLKFNFIQRVKEMKVNILINSLDVDDYIVMDNLGSLPTKLISSKSNLNETSTDLFQVDYLRQQRIVNHEGTLIEVFDQNVELDMEQLHLSLNAKSVLTLINYSLTTFIDPTGAEAPADVLRHNDEDREDAPQKTLMKIRMAGLTMDFNEDNINIASWILTAGEFSLILLPERMKISMKLGNMEVLDGNSSKTFNNEFKKLITLEGEEEVELIYETFDPADNDKDYDSIFTYKAASLHINFVEESLNRIISYFNKFMRMKSLFEKAREVTYNQTPSIDSVNNMKLDVNIRSPIIIFPKLSEWSDEHFDKLEFHSGDFIVSNVFIMANEGHKINDILINIKECMLSSVINLESNSIQDFNIIKDLGLDLQVKHNPHSKIDEPTFNVNGVFNTPPTSLTELQLSFLFSLSDRIMQAFSIDDVQSDELDKELHYVNHVVDTASDDNLSSSGLIDSINPSPQLKKADEEGVYVDFSFEIPEIIISLFNNTVECTNLDKYGLTKFKFEKLGVKLITNYNGTLSGESFIGSFTIDDIRDIKDNKHTELIPKLSAVENSFISKVSRILVNGSLTTTLSITIDNPMVILAMDYLFELKSFYDNSIGLASKVAVSGTVNLPSEAELKPTEDDIQSNPFQYTFSIINPQVILLADVSDIKSEAVVFKVGEIQFSSQNIQSLLVNNVGVFLSKLNSENDYKVRLLDDFSSSVIIDQRNSTTENMLTEITSSIEPLLMRISLRDIRLAMLIFNKTVALMNKASQESSAKRKSLTDSVSKEEIPTGTDLNTTSKELVKRKSNDANSTIPTILGENLHIEVGGLRLVLIGDVHEMPILDMNINAFEVFAKDWSTELDAMATLETYVNVFNYARSSWEPLIEPVPISFHLSNGLDEDSCMVFEIVTRKIAEITLSSRSLSMLSQIPNSLSGELILKPRGLEKPYILYNDTELNINVWKVTDTQDERINLITLAPGSSLPWEFEDWRTVREKLDIDNKRSMLGFAISGSKYSTTMKINATNEGEQLFVLEPPVDHVHNRLICDLKSTEDNIKMITFRSTLILENTTEIDIQFMVINENNPKQIIHTVSPSDTKSIPLEMAYSSIILVKPVSDDFLWPDQKIQWKDLLTKPISIECKSESTEEKKYYFEVNGKFDTKEPLAKIFPRMKIIVSSPIVIENLLPCDLNFSLIDKRKDGNNYTFLEKRGKIFIHDVSLDTFLLLSVQPLMDNAIPSKPAIVNTPPKSSLDTETDVSLTLDDGEQMLKLKLFYQSVEGTRAKIIRIYSPYIIRNSTGKEIFIQDGNGNLAQSRLVLDSQNSYYTTPKMFSFLGGIYDNNRANIRFKDSDWSIPLSFDAIGQSHDVVLNIPNKNQDSNLGMTVYEGEGKYSLSKIIEFAPRYMVYSDLDFAIELCEAGSTASMELEAKASVPMYRMRNIVNKQLKIKFLGANTDWSSPFFIKDVGSTFLKVLKTDKTHMLLKIEIVLDKATLLIRITDGKNLWPYSIRNFSDQEFIFYQRDPRVIDDYYESEEVEEITNIEYKPLYYRVPARSIMPYAWDYPAARQKRMILTCRGRKREVNIAEIGNLTPMRLPGNAPNDPVDMVEISVIADGPTQALTITNYSQSSSLYKLNTKFNASSSSINSSREIFEGKEVKETIFRKLIINFKGLGVSFINKRLQELFYLSISDVKLKYIDSDLSQTFSWSVQWLQVDDQLFNANFPNVVYPTLIEGVAADMSDRPVLLGSVSKLKDDKYGVLYFKHLTVLLQELSIQLDEDFLYALIDFVKVPGAAWNKNTQEVIYNDIVTLPEFKELKLSEDVYFEVFHIQPTMLHLSFVRSETITKEDEGASKLDDSERNTRTLSFFINVLTMTIGNVNDAAIRMNSLYMDNLSVPVDTLINSIRTHYGQQFIYQLHKILGSADFLGNPVGLFNTISSGVWDLFYEPYKGYIMNDRPGDIGINIAKGSLSFAKKTVFGISDSMSKVTGSMAKGLSITQDMEFQESRRLQNRITNNSRNVLATSAQSFATTIGSGLSGIALDPYKGVQKEGAAGFIKGIGKGLFGLPTKTAIGILDLTNNLSQGVKSTTTITNATTNPGRVRMTRYIGHDNIIKTYNLREAQGQCWLKTANGGVYMNDRYLAHVVLPGRQLTVVVSMQHIAEIKIADEEIMWSTAYQDIQGIILEKGGIEIKLKSQAEYFIPIADRLERKSIYRNIAIAVTEYNKYCEATL
ncbi:hypothetical protein TPHA_0F00220 [Tetrapisispora phaffii CBS 4417]|uniref:Vacuolar protein sorting-associated protein n=1 Tax=Tetrapisispora phaffii (strain ATCC 24235 / CBS 4417 / NBRC 1672 / NRRL Y-8282 / UCD 70-5) TaxID=1071381 RepID=G8BUS7_TETPH|nr:hypothetical protein TPHA_0F00220 [Tetrapisispora phaffii CBS 4417]CCE63509.1 hypothetical protein TPHA_0F00220 [Tetrapisispora phaffii CBS 4417]